MAHQRHDNPRPTQAPRKPNPAPDEPVCIGTSELTSWGEVETLAQAVIDEEALKYRGEPKWEVGAVFVQLIKPAPSNKSHWLGYSKKHVTVNLGLDATKETDITCESLTAICTHSVDHPGATGSSTWYYYPPNGGVMCFP